MIDQINYAKGKKNYAKRNSYMKVNLLVDGNQVHEVDFDDRSLLNDNSLQYHNIDTHQIKGHYRVSKHEKFRVFILEMCNENVCELELVSVHGQVEMTFLLEGNIRCQFFTEEPNSEICGPAHNIFHSIAGNRKITIHSKITRWMVIVFPTPSFLEYVPHIPELRDFRNSISEDRPGFLYKYFEPLNINMSRLIHEIEHCSSDFPFKCLLIKIKVLELLWNQVDIQPVIKENDAGLLDTEFQKICQAKAIVENNFIDPPALSELARQVGSNEFYLKKGFKSLTGTTVYGYIRELKMKKAVELLQEQKWTLQQVAEAVGYKYAQHFSTAFKKNYGVPPGRFREV